MREEPRLRVAAFRPDDDRLDGAVELLESLGAEPVPDPMLAVEPGTEGGDSGTPRTEPGYAVLTSRTGGEPAAPNCEHVRTNRLPRESCPTASSISSLQSTASHRSNTTPRS